MRQARHRVLVALAIVVGLGGWALLAGEENAPTAPVAAGADAPPRPGRGHADDPDGSEPVLFQVASSGMPAADPDASVPITVSRNAALQAGQSGRLTVALPDGTRYPVHYERSESAPDGNWTFVGRVDTSLGQLASVITFGKDGVFGTLPTPDGGTMKITTRAGQAYLQPAGWSVPPGVDPSLHPDYVLPEPAKSAPSVRAATSTLAGATIGQLADTDGGPVTITILATYTSNLSRLRGSRAAAETEYRNLVAVMNQAHVDSGSRARFEIAGFVEIDYPADAWNSAARADIIDNTLPDGTNLHALRDQGMADLVALIRPYVEGDLTCGISQFPGNELQPHFLDRGTGFSVTAVEACAPLVFAHEIGHNLGLMHDRETIAGAHGATLSYGTWPFSFGHRQLGPPGFATVMAYDSESRPRLGYFSHPGTTLCGGAACGDAALSDNVRSINLVADSIARFRDPPGLMSINDLWTYEHSSDLVRTMRVELSSPAPAGGITFDVVVEDGSAVLGTDADVEPGAQLVDVVIAQGQQVATVPVRVYADDLAEPSETLRFRLENVRGAVAVRDTDATMTIVDYDRTVRVEGRVRFPPGVDPGEEFVRVQVDEIKDGVRDGDYAIALPPDYRYSLDVVQGAFLALDASTGPLQMPRVVIEQVNRPTTSVDLSPRAMIRLAGSLHAVGRPVGGVPVLLWNPRGDGTGYYVNWSSSNYAATYAMDVLPGAAMQLEVRDPPAPYVRQIVEIPPLAQGATWNLPLRDVPSLTIPHVTVTEGTGAEGARTVLLTAGLSVPRSKTGVSFDIAVAGNADGNDFRLPTTHFSIPRNRTRVEVPIVIVGDDLTEEDEVVELRITNVQGAAWNPGPGSVRIASDDKHPGDDRCTGPAADGAVRMCQ